jgi:hypothetical protein
MYYLGSGLLLLLDSYNSFLHYNYYVKQPLDGGNGQQEACLIRISLAAKKKKKSGITPPSTVCKCMRGISCKFSQRTKKN